MDKEYFKTYYQKNKEKIKNRSLEYRLSNPKESKKIIHEKQCVYCESTFNTHCGHKKYCSRECFNKFYVKNNKEKIANNRKKYAKENYDKLKIHRLKQKEKKKNYDKTYVKLNRVIINEKRKERLHLNHVFSISHNIRVLIGRSLRKYGYSKESKTCDILGCSFEEFKCHLESKFEPWMNWGNRGVYNGELNYGWDVDHIIPLSTATCVEDVIRLNHYTNLQPLCSKFNRDIKIDRID
jgi:hypothetical protein